MPASYVWIKLWPGMYFGFVAPLNEPYGLGLPLRRVRRLPRRSDIV